MSSDLYEMSPARQINFSLELTFSPITNQYYGGWLGCRCLKLVVTGDNLSAHLMS